VNRRAADHLKNKIGELELRLAQISKFANTADPALDAEQRAILASLPLYKEALTLELAKRARAKTK
jgi:hypothetical protein